MQPKLPLDLPTKLPVIREILRGIHGPQRDPLRHDPNEQFLKAMLSARTLDDISEAVFQFVKCRFLSLDELANATLEELIGIIGPVTYAEDKAAYLLEAVRFMRAYRGRVDLEFLRKWPVEDALHWLRKRRGIGPKVGATILNFSDFRHRIFAIDTHVLRVLKRVGALPAHATSDFAHKAIMLVIPDDWDADDLYELHWLIKMHGQRTCSHDRPMCATCPLASICTTAAGDMQADAA
jgi:endonuclease-3